jgi:galactose mutarotase-like enzyme
MSAVTEPPTGTELALEHERQRVVVAELGAALRSWTVRGRELLDTIGPGEPDDAFRGKVLVPWPNRLRDGRYVFDGAEHRTALTEPERATALHGLATGHRWRAIRSSTRHLTLADELAPQPGYPFALRLSVDYELTSGGVVVTLHATNTGTTAAPFGAGLHPYLTHGTATVDELVLEVPARAYLPVDERRLPTGAAIAVDGTDFDFRRGRPIGGLRLDTCFGDLGRSPAGVARVRLASAGGERQLTVWMDESFRFVQVYTADDVPDAARRRRGVAIEPMTCAPDAFNSGDGLVVLEPGASFTGRCGLTATGF